MAIFSISASVNIEAEDYDEAYRTAHEILEQLNSIGDSAGIIDIEELDE